MVHPGDGQDGAGGPQAPVHAPPPGPAVAEPPTGQGPAYEEQEGLTYLGKAFTKCKPVWKREGVDNPEFTCDDVQLGRPLRLRCGGAGAGVSASSRPLCFAAWAPDSCPYAHPCCAHRRALNHIALGVEDVDVIARFWCKVSRA